MIVVNPSTRQFNIPGADLVFGVEHDNGSERKYFQCPRYVGNNLDLAGSFVRMNYRNANGEIDSYLVVDLSLDGYTVTFSWELTPKVTMYKGQINFVMCLVGPDTKVKWHTTIGRGQVLEGLEPDSDMVESGTADIVAQLIALVEAQTAAVTAEGSKQIAAVQAAAKAAETASVAEIEAKRANSLASIPSDYTSMANTVDGLVRGSAGGIVCEVDGTVVTASDASDNHIRGLRIFGRSTQDGVPSPDSPVEIVSVDKPVVTAAGKNLIPPVTGAISSQGITSAPTNEGTVLLDGTATQEISRVVTQNFLLQPGKYTLSVDGIHTVDGNKDRVYLNAADGSGTIVNYVMVGKPVTFEIVSSIVIRAAIVFAAGSTYVNEVARIQLEAGDIATDYEPYKPVQTIETTNVLHGIPLITSSIVTVQSNYTDADGRRWVCDEVDLERGVYVQRITKHIIDGSRPVALLSTTAEKTRFDVDWIVGVTGGALMCDSLEWSVSQAVNTAQIHGDTGKLVLFVNKATNVADFLAYLAEHPIMLLIQTSPVEIPLSETEIAAYRALRTYKPNTTILNDNGAHMSVSYTADTKLYIDNKLAALMGNI